MSNFQFRSHIYNIYQQFSELNLKDDEIIPSVDFSRNYENKSFHEIQSAYFGHEAFTIFTCACYYHCLDNENNDNSDDNDNGLKVIPIAVVSNEVNHERNSAFHCSQKVIKMVCNQIDRAINTVHV